MPRYSVVVKVNKPQYWRTFLDADNEAAAGARAKELWHEGRNAWDDGSNEFFFDQEGEVDHASLHVVQVDYHHE